MSTKVPEKYGITRIDHRYGEGLTLGFNVRIQKNKIRFVKFFSDAEYGSEKGSLDAAKQYRDKVLADNPTPTRADHSQIVRRKTDSDIVGVSLYVNVDTRNNKKYVYEFWRAWWSPTKGKYKTKLFSINKYGNQKARQMAIKAREDGLKQMQDMDDGFLNLSNTLSKKRK